VAQKYFCSNAYCIGYTCYASDHAMSALT